MTYEPDPNGDRFSARRESEETSYAVWILGGAIALALIMGIFIFGSSTDQTRTASNVEPTTTGSATSDVPKGPTTIPKPAPFQPAEPK